MGDLDILLIKGLQKVMIIVRNIRSFIASPSTRVIHAVSHQIAKFNNSYFCLIDLNNINLLRSRHVNICELPSVDFVRQSPHRQQ